MRSSAEELVRDSDVVVISNASEQFREVLAKTIRADQVLVDLVRITDDRETLKCQYHGVCW